MSWSLLLEDLLSTSRWLPMRYAIRLRNFSAHCLLLSPTACSCRSHARVLP